MPNTTINDKSWQSSTVASYGCPPNGGERPTCQLVIHDFENLQHRQGECFVSQIPSKVLNRTWKVVVYPRGDPEDEDDHHEWVTVFLGFGPLKQEEIKVSFTIILGSSLSPPQDVKHDETHTFSKEKEKGCGFLRKNVLKRLNDDGSLEINIYIRKEDKDRSCWYPKIKDISSFDGKRLMENPVNSDIVFSIGGGQEKFQGHSNILFVRAPGLYQLVNNATQGEDFEIPGVQVSTFEAVLEYIYVGTLPTAEDEDNAKELLDLANKFGCVDLKLWLESEIASKMINASNAADWLLVADGQTCPLLKEECMEICKENFDVVEASSGWKNMRESTDLLEELIRHCSNTSNSSDPISFDDYNRMDVGTLRNRLQAYEVYGHNELLDGTKKMLIGKLKKKAELKRKRQEDIDDAGGM